MDTDTIQVGDIVRITDDASYFTGQPITPWVKSLYWQVSSISGARVLIGKSADGHYTLNIPINIKHLIKITD